MKTKGEKHAEKVIAGLDGKRVVVSLSGGLDSPTVMGFLLNAGSDVVVVSFDYGQIHDKELLAMREIVRYYKEKFPGRVHGPMLLNTGFMRAIGGSALTDDAFSIPTGRSEEEMKKIPITYVPGRNTIFISCALSVAEVQKCDAVAVGVNSVDFSGYPDCRPEYIKEWNALAKLSSQRAVEGNPIRVIAPLQHMTKAEIITFGRSFTVPVPYQYTWSCYKGGDLPCGTCDSCVLRNNGFKAHNEVDPSIEFWKKKNEEMKSF